MNPIKLESFPSVQNKQAGVPKQGNAHFLIAFLVTAKNNLSIFLLDFTLIFYYSIAFLSHVTLIF